MPERLDPHLFEFHLHLETCEQCRGPDKHLCALGLQLLFHAAQAGELDLVTPIALEKVSFDTARPQLRA
ncbi:MAG: hypothetical protein PHQ12_11400 [Chthoniobacteraceae bacterium]|nr:hypothetical protein [Chthoniobacteraceae bacterium]